MSAPRVVHLLRWFEPATQELRGEEVVRDAPLEALRQLFALGPRDPVLNVYPIGDEEARWLASRVRHAIDRDAYVYYVEAQQQLEG
jgi:hypothetical protein